MHNINFKNESLITTTITTVLTKSKETEQKEVKIENDEVKFEKSAKNDKLRSDNWLTSKIFSTPGLKRLNDFLNNKNK